MEKQAMRQPDGRFGVGNNVGGRPLGARAQLGEEFCRVLYEDFMEHGPQAIAAFREKDPSGYARGIIALMPKALTVSSEDLKLCVIDMTGIDDDDNSLEQPSLAGPLDDEVSDNYS